VNMSEFASAAAMSSIIGQSLNPHDLARSPSGSSGGTGVAIAAAYAPIGLGTDTGGSIRGPATSNGVAALKPTHGLLSRDGIIPLALSFDTGGPFARNVADVAVALGVMTGIDPADAATKKSDGKFERDYTKYLNAGALKGARIGVARDFMGADPDVDWVMESSFAAMKKAGATIVDVRYPKWLLDTRTEFYNAVRWPEFPPQIATYLATLGAKYPKNIGDLIARAELFNSPRGDQGPNPSRWSLFKREAESGTMDDPKYISVHDHILPAIRIVVEGVLAGQKLDAIVYPTSSTRPGLIAAPAGTGPGAPSATNIANLTGFPDLIVPAGFTSDRLPVGISFFGPAFSEPKLLGLGYAFEQATKARRRPVTTPLLPGETITLK
jgi:amidase